MKTYPSIFNDCLSPVSPGPSSSNTAGPYRLGSMAVDLLEGKPSYLYIEMAKEGGYFATFYGMHSDKAFLAGILKKDIRTYDFDQIYTDAESNDFSYTFEFTDSVPAKPSESAWLTLRSDNGDKSLSRQLLWAAERSSSARWTVSRLILTGNFTICWCVLPQRRYPKFIRCSLARSPRLTAATGKA